MAVTKPAHVRKFKSLQEFYPFYIGEHSKPLTKLFHFIGTFLVICIFLFSMWTENLGYLIYMPVAGYSFAWASHFFIEQNKPATFKYPTYSLASDFIMFYELLVGKRKFGF
eukprot:ANDGO_03410.mRNA.1 hypothetical protein DICPUDRAFT_151843